MNDCPYKTSPQALQVEYIPQQIPVKNKKGGKKETKLNTNKDAALTVNFKYELLNTKLRRKNTRWKKVYIFSNKFPTQKGK